MNDDELAYFQMNRQITRMFELYCGWYTSLLWIYDRIYYIISTRHYRNKEDHCVQIRSICIASNV